MIKALARYLKDHPTQTSRLLLSYCGQEKRFLPRSDLLNGFEAFLSANDTDGLSSSPLAAMLRSSQEAALEKPWMYLLLRPEIGVWRYLRLHMETLEVQEVSVSEFLACKERLVDGPSQTSECLLEIDLGPFNRDLPKLTQTRSIGKGVSFLNRRLSSELFQNLHTGDRQLLEFLRVHNIRGTQLLLNGKIEDVPHLRMAVRQAEDFLHRQPSDLGWDPLGGRLRELGFEPGWGKDTARMLETFRLLAEILEAPSPEVFEQFLSRIPMIFNVVIFSPHGYFGQSNVLGLPDTGGQIVYILDQVQALEKEMRFRLEEQGIRIDPKILVVTRLIPEARGTTCDQPTERIDGTRNAQILRVPFRTREGEIVPHWISRFEVWPYLERFALEAEGKILEELGGRPALIIGNYSDGCLVASLLSRRLQVTQCNIAHALEKSKYQFSDLFWRENDDRYHFSCQFTADLIGMNAADFIITSTYQEIAGTAESMGQYESYSAFTMPGLYRVANGIDVLDPKFNVVSPGANPEIYFPHTEKKRRRRDLTPRIEELVLGDGGPSALGHFREPDKPIVFTMARLDRIKNLTGLVQWYGANPPLRELANLLVVGGSTDPENSSDHEEREQISLMHRLFERHDLDGQVRWVGFQGDRNLVGELYRWVADRRGVFVQPALFEAYGLTVVEAMISGLPTFATCHGGPSEIIEHGRSGFHIDPDHPQESGAAIQDFLEQCARDPEVWDRMSARSVERIQASFTWKLYGQLMMTLARVYGFWKFVTNLDREETRRYLDMFYSLEYRRLSREL